MATTNLQDSLTALATSLGTVPDMLVTYGVKVEIDTTPTGTSPTFAQLCAGIENLDESLNEEVQQYFFMCGAGFATNYVTGMAPKIKLKGRRIIGDTAQDYIFGATVKYGRMKNRATHMRLTKSSTNNANEIISANVTLTALGDINGDVTDGSEIEIEISIDGSPIAGDAWPTT